MKRITLTLISCLIAIFAIADDYKKQENVNVVAYNISLTLSDEVDSIYGLNEISFEVLSPILEISFDLRPSMQVSAVTLDGNTATFKRTDDRILVEIPPDLSLNNHMISISYRGIPTDGLIISKNKFGDRTFFGDNWPNRAHHWFPCIDHPSDKAMVAFHITAPVNYEVVANGMRTEKINLGNGQSLTSYECKNPIPTKVMVFGAAKFATEFYRSEKGNNMETWVYQQDRENGFYDYRLAGDIVDYFEANMTQFPYIKLANVQSKTRYGGMENAGCIFYHEGSVTGDRNAEELIAHEVAHQWFGNTASELHWEDVWLSEGFATYLTGLYLKDTYGQERFDAYMQKAKELVFNYNSKFPETAIIPNSTKDLNSILNPMSYQKAAWVLFMLSNQFYEENNWHWLTHYYLKYKFSNASTEDFLALVPENNNLSIERFKEQWLTSSVLPTVNYSYKFNARYNEISLRLNQTQSTKKAFLFPVEVGVVYDNGKMLVDTYPIEDRNSKLIIPVKSEPKEIIIDPNNKLLVKFSFTP